MKKKMVLLGYEAEVEYRIVDGEAEVFHISNIIGGNSIIIESMGLVDVAKDMIDKEIKDES